MNYHKKYMFRVEIDGVPVAAFKKAGPLKVTVGVVEEHEGGSLAPRKEPGKAKFENLTLEHGVTDSRDMWKWMKECVSGKDSVRRDLALCQTDRAGVEIKRWNVFNAFPCEFEAGDWDANSEENVVEKMVLAYDSFDLAY